MERINSKRTGQGYLSPMQTIVTVSMVLIWAGIALSMVLFGVNIYITMLIMGLLAGAGGLFFFIVVIDNENFANLLIWLYYRYRVARGKTIVHPLTMSLKDMQKHVPIKRIHDGGMIEYIDNWGVLFRYDPAEEIDGKIDEFTDNVERYVNSIGVGVEVSFNFYNTIDRSDNLKNEILSAINDGNKTTAQKQHLYGIYTEITSNPLPKVSSGFLMSVKLGKHKNHHVAQAAYNSVVPGMLQRMGEIGIHTMAVTESDAIINEFYKFAALEGL